MKTYSAAQFGSTDLFSNDKISSTDLFPYNLLELMTTESVPDCRLITKERILIEAHKLILFQSPHLRSLITSVSCDEGKCPIQETVTLILPDISYRHLDPIIRYFYTGHLIFPATEKPVIKDILLRMFKIPPDYKFAVPQFAQLNNQNHEHQAKNCQEKEKETMENPEDDNDQEEEDIEQISKLVAIKLEERGKNNHNRPKSAHLYQGFYKMKKVTVQVPLNIQTKIQCLTCHSQVRRSPHHFKRHLVWKHLYPLWTEIGTNKLR